MNDDDLLDYAWHHSKTERALFSHADVVRVLELAGEDLAAWFSYPKAFWSVGTETMHPLVTAARQRFRLNAEARRRALEEKAGARWLVAR